MYPIEDFGVAESDSLALVRRNRVIDICVMSFLRNHALYGLFYHQLMSEADSAKSSKFKKKSWNEMNSLRYSRTVDKNHCLSSNYTLPQSTIIKILMVLQFSVYFVY